MATETDAELAARMRAVDLVAKKRSWTAERTENEKRRVERDFNLWVIDELVRAFGVKGEGRGGMLTRENVEESKLKIIEKYKDV